MSPQDSYHHCGLVIAAGGSGARFGGWKQLAPLAGKPLLVRTVEALNSLPFRDRVLVLPAALLQTAEWDAVRSEYPILQNYQHIPGGKERVDSVRRGVEALDAHCSLAAIHDAARPFPPLTALHRCMTVLHDKPDVAAAIVAAPCLDTIKRVASGGVIRMTDNRDELRRAETPQVVRRELFLEAAASPQAEGSRDDAEVLERFGLHTSCVQHVGWNPKVTHHEDLIIAEALYRLHSAETRKP